MLEKKDKRFHTEDLCDLGAHCIGNAIKTLNKGLRHNMRERYLSHVTLENTAKSSLLADLDVEKDFEVEIQNFQKSRFKQIELYGEECLGSRNIDLTDAPGTYVLVDALDGSDLYEREIHNWCSAAIFFTPKNPIGKRIRAAIVGIPDETIYIASDIENSEVMVTRRNKDDIQNLRGMSEVNQLSNASICFYGQKVGNLLSTLKSPIWESLLNTSATKKKQLVPRIYNLAGIPMLMKLIDKPSTHGSGIDVVIDLVGQHAHDVVPGAFIAKKAGATMLNLNGAEITFEKLEESMLKPNTDAHKLKLSLIHI